MDFVSKWTAVSKLYKLTGYDRIPLLGHGEVVGMRGQEVVTLAEGDSTEEALDAFISKTVESACQEVARERAIAESHLAAAKVLEDLIAALKDPK